MTLPFGKLEVKITKINEDSIEITIHDHHKIEIKKEFVMKKNLVLNEVAHYQIAERDGLFFQEIV